MKRRKKRNGSRKKKELTWEEELEQDLEALKIPQSEATEADERLEADLVRVVRDVSGA